MTVLYFSFAWLQQVLRSSSALWRVISVASQTEIGIALLTSTLTASSSLLLVHLASCPWRPCASAAQATVRPASVVSLAMEKRASFVSPGYTTAIAASLVSPAKAMPFSFFFLAPASGAENETAMFVFFVSVAIETAIPAFLASLAEAMPASLVPVVNENVMPASLVFWALVMPAFLLLLAMSSHVSAVSSEMAIPASSAPSEMEVLASSASSDLEMFASSASSEMGMPASSVSWAMVTPASFLSVASETEMPSPCPFSSFSSPLPWQGMMSSPKRKVHPSGALARQSVKDVACLPLVDRRLAFVRQL